MANFTFSISENRDGPLLAVRSGDNYANVHVTDFLADHPVIGGPVSALRGGLMRAAEHLQARAPDLTPSGFNKVAREAVAKHVTDAFKAVQRTFPEAIAELNEQRARTMTAKFLKDQPEAIRVEQRQYARSLQLPDLMQRVQDDPVLGASIIEGGLGMSGLPADIFERLVRDVEIAHVEAVNLSQRPNDYRAQPTADNPIGGEVNKKKLRADAERLATAFDDQREALDTVPNMLANAVTVVALMLDTNRSAAFEMLAG